MKEQQNHSFESTKIFSKIKRRLAGNNRFQNRFMVSLVQTSKIITQKHKAHETKKFHDFNQGTTNSTINSTLLETCTKSTEDLQKRNLSFRRRIMPLLVQTSKITTL